MESLFSFPVGLLHPLQHAGLSRRTPVCRRSRNCAISESRAFLGSDAGIEWPLFSASLCDNGSVVPPGFSVTDVVMQRPIGSRWPVALRNEGHLAAA